MPRRLEAMKWTWTLLLALLIIAGAATGLTLNKRARAHVLGVWQKLALHSAHADEPLPDKSWVDKPKTPWDHTLTLTDDEIKAIGLEKVAVVEQKDPTILPLFGTTDYVPSTVTLVRTLF